MRDLDEIMADHELWYHVVNQEENQLKQLLENNRGTYDLDKRDASGRTLLDYCCDINNKSTETYSPQGMIENNFGKQNLRNRRGHTHQNWFACISGQPLLA